MPSLHRISATPAIVPTAAAAHGTLDNLPMTDERVLTFRLGAVEYAIGILDVQEIRGYVAPTAIPAMPAYMKGVLNLRGTIVPVIDLRVLFGMRAGLDPTTVTVVLHLDGRVVAVVVDAVSDVVELEQLQIQPAPHLGDGLLADNVRGVLTLGSADHPRTVLSIDIVRLLAALRADTSPAVQ
jgi:purine-binding chemotaxis protein CheW